MSQLVLDDPLDITEVLPPLQNWIKVQRLRDLRPREHILDDRIPQILLSLNQPTFITIDRDFWNKNLCHPAYAILYFALRDDQQGQLAGLLRALFRQSEFRSRSRRMGKVARVGPVSISWWQFQSAVLRQISWKRASPGG